MTERRAAAPGGVSGPLLFARYAYPPNALGYCGPSDSLALLEYASAGVTDDGLRALGQGFEGAWPYLRLIAGVNGIDDPLDARVVEAYWLGNSLLEQVAPSVFASFLDETFGPRAGRRRSLLLETAANGAVPTHSLHVFGVYPWVGLLRAGRVSEPLRVLEGCRIRWGTVETIGGDVALVRSQPVVWDGTRLGLGPERTEPVTLSAGGLGLAGRLEVGEVVSMHWHWVCDRLSPRQAAALSRHTARTLAVVNSLEQSPVAVLG